VHILIQIYSTHEVSIQTSSIRLYDTRDN